MADPSADTLKVFISYSRKDSAEFADELVLGLEDRGFAPFLDRHDIKPGEPWEARLGGLIEQSDTVVFVISPESVKSKRCIWEVDKALALSKRLLPVIYKSVSDGEIPEKLSKLQFVRFDTAPGMMRPLREIVEALRVDLEWIREHTRLAELAAHWQSRNRPESLLLRGDDVNAAKAWTAKRKQDAPEITEVQRAFLSESERAESARIAESKVARSWTRRLQILVYGLLAGIILVIIAVIEQAHVKERWSWYMIIRPYKATNVDPYVLRADAERALKPGDTFRECVKDCPEMIVVPAGEFMMGSPTTENGRYDDEGPQHGVSIVAPFAVSKFDVTFADWDACAGVGGCSQEGRANDAGWGRGTRPVIYVSSDDAQQYVAWLSRMTGKAYRLLSESEWEYAARAGSTTTFYWGDAIGKENGNCNGCGSQWDGRQTSPVGSFKPNAFGLYDMAGNVWQWVQDCYHDNYRGAPTDGSARITGDCSRRVMRGGAWLNIPQDLRSAYRNSNPPGDRGYIVGFRVGRMLTP